MLGDINRELLATYRNIRSGHPAVSKLLRKMRKGRRRYYEIRAVDPQQLSRTERAARFIYLNRCCFNGLYRTNRNGDFNVPYGGKGSGPLPSPEDLRHASHLLRRATLIDDDFENVLIKVKPGDFVYLDPPFSVSGRRVFNEYDASVFTSNDVARLRTWLERLDRMGIPFVVSYVESPEGKYLSNGFNVSAVTVRRNIAGFLSSRIRCHELLISNRP